MNAQIVFPSVVGLGETDLGLLSLGTFSKRKADDQPYQVAWEGMTYLVGPHVHRFARPVERMDFLRLSEGPESRALTYTALGLLLPPGEHQVHVMVGAPVEVMANQELAQRFHAGLRTWLVGEHAFTLNGQAYCVHVAHRRDIQVMAQPAGAFFSWGMNDAGVWAKGSHTLEASVAVCDLGFNTLDVFSVRGGQIEGRYTGGDTVGMRRAAEYLVRSLAQQHGLKLSLHEADDLLRQPEPVWQTHAGPLNLLPLKQQALAVTVGEVVSFLESRWGNGRQFAHLLFTGGGTEMLNGELLRHYPHATRLTQPVTANALGLARYGRRVFKDAPVVVGFDPGFGGIKAVAL